MRQSAAPSEIGRLAAPLVRLFDAAWRRMSWWVAALALLYAGSGITVIRADEVAIVLRWGRLVGYTPALQEHGPGLLFAFPRPVDEVVRVKTRHVWELPIQTLASGTSFAAYTNQLDPLTVGYALTGDQNIVHVEMVARYQVREPAEWALHGPRAENILRVEISAAMLRSLGEMDVDHVLSDGRKALLATATHRAQEGLDAARSGLDLVSLELTDLRPPRMLAADFDAVQSAFIEAETHRKEADAYAQKTIPRARAEADTTLQAARADAAAALGRARGDADAFTALDHEYRANPAVVRERLYRDAVVQAIVNAGTVRGIPPPVGGRYTGLRLVLGPGLTEFRAMPPPVVPGGLSESGER